MAQPGRGSLSRMIRVAAAAVVLASCAPALARAQDGVGFHGGATVDPEQGFFGLHYFAPLSSQLKVHPAADVGFGSDLTLVSLRADFAQWFELGRTGTWSLYFGGGPAINLYRFDTGAGDDAELEAEGGFDFVAGFSSKRGPMLEVRVGSSGSPDLRFAVGYTFGR
jgi:hypothetical protein